VSTDLVELLAQCHDDVGLYHEAVLGRVPLYPKQEAIADSVLHNRVTVVPAGHAVGKTHVAATTILHWLYTRPGSKVISTSPSNNQLVSVLWAGIKQAHRQSLIPLKGTITDGNITPQRLEIAPNWFAIGFSAKKPESISGFHGQDLLVVVDESSGIAPDIWDAVESLGYTALLALGNPLRSSGHFKGLWDLCEGGESGYHGIHLSAFDSPYAEFTDEEVRAAGLPQGLCSKTWIEGVRKVYGESSLYWITRVLARFPSQDHDQLIPTGWLDRCLNAKRAGGGPRYLAVDIAKGTGKDRTVILVSDYFGVLHLYQDNRTSVQQAAQLVAQYSSQFGVNHSDIVYDASGWAGTDMSRYLQALGIRSARQYFGGAPVKSRYANRRAQYAWRLRQRLDPTRPIRPRQVQGVGVPGREPHHLLLTAEQAPFSIPLGPFWGELREELLGLRYSHDGPKLRLEDKSEFAQRLGRSPDLGDSAIMTASCWPWDE
jgi:hypothetical protein